MRYTDYKFRWVQMLQLFLFLLYFWLCLLSLCFLPFCLFASLLFRLAKSTLTLIPLLGIHQVVFIFVTDESTKATISLRLTKLFMDLFFSSFQVGPQNQTVSFKPNHLFIFFSSQAKPVPFLKRPFILNQDIKYPRILNYCSVVPILVSSWRQASFTVETLTPLSMS